MDKRDDLIASANRGESILKAYGKVGSGRADDLIADILAHVFLEASVAAGEDQEDRRYGGVGQQYDTPESVIDEAEELLRERIKEARDEDAARHEQDSTINGGE